MSKIHILDSFVYNRISAGEVVEKPASVVKELVENSIDAGATSISVEIKDGGISLIKISDNGHGIDKDDLKTAFLPHATSKIIDIADLDSIKTLGFRGEALSSICAVADVCITTKTKNNDCGFRLNIRGANFSDITPIASNDGTTIIVENLFFNIPARAKFLRRPKTEENDITNYVQRLIISNPNLEFKYIVDNEIVYNYKPTGNFFDAMKCIYSNISEKNVIKVDYEYNQYKISGYISTPESAKNNRSYQILNINGRYVVNNIVSTAIQRAYEEFLMKGKFPLFCLNLTIPYESIDVNVHPNKLDVKFEDSKSIFNTFYNACFYALDNSLKPTKAITQTTFNSIIPTETKLQIVEEGTSFKYQNQNTSSIIKDILSETQPNMLEQRSSGLAEIILSSIITQEPAKEKVPVLEQQTSLLNTIDFKTIGIIFNTYILVEHNSNVLLIDQHAAHERLNYDKLTHELENNEIVRTPLLVPFTLSLSATEMSFIEESIPSLNEMGFNIEVFGKNSIKVSETPMCLDSINLKIFFEEILTNINSYMNKPINFIKNILKTTACKASIKAGQPLSNNEIQTLITNFENAKSILCPHGRPVIICLSKKEIEKWFKRIV